jgi:hypothetical protein
MNLRQSGRITPAILRVIAAPEPHLRLPEPEETRRCLRLLAPLELEVRPALQLDVTI